MHQLAYEHWTVNGPSDKYADNRKNLSRHATMHRVGEVRFVF